MLSVVFFLIGSFFERFGLILDEFIFICEAFFNSRGRSDHSKKRDFYPNEVK